jgi:predicted ATPase
MIEQARILFGRVRERRSEKSIFLTGLRGAGKTVLLNEMERMAARTNDRTVSVEAHEGKALARLGHCDP